MIQGQVRYTVPGEDKQFTSKKLLVVDDEQVICDLIEEILTVRGYHVLTANSGAEALSKFRCERPFLVLLDIKMPGMNGIEVLKRMRAMDSSTTVIIVSGLQDEELAKHALELGASDYILKPVDPDYLETCVFTYLARNTW